MTIPIKMNNGTAISWSFNIVEFVFNVINKVVNLKFDPQIPKIKAKKIKVNEIGKPMKITKIIVPSMIDPIIGFDKLGRAFIRSVNHSPPGVISGAKTAMTTHNNAIK